jgi:hypothetical protein
VARIVPLDVAPEKFVLGTLKGLLGSADEQILLDAPKLPGAARQQIANAAAAYDGSWFM